MGQGEIMVWVCNMWCRAMVSSTLALSWRSPALAASWRPPPSIQPATHYHHLHH